MNNKYLQTAGVIIIGIVILFLLPKRHAPEPVTVNDFQSCQNAGGEVFQTDPLSCKLPDGRIFEEEEILMPDVVLDSPKYGDLVKSPLTIVGKARGTWFFEANLPVTLKDDKGNILVQIGAQAQSDWMTTEYVPFSATLKFDPKDAAYGVLIINKDNPSGNPDLDSSFAIPVRFK